MSNICTNLFYAYSEDRQNINVILEFFNNWPYSTREDNGNSVDIYFDSNWVFPEKSMENLFELIPNKDDIYITCLSYELGNLYHALWVCDEDGWREE